MPTDKLTIVPVSLDPLPTEISTPVSSPVAAVPSCVIKTNFGEISLFNRTPKDGGEALFETVIFSHRLYRYV